MHIIKMIRLGGLIGLLQPCFAYAEVYQQHQREHGGQIFQVSHLQSMWSLDQNNHGIFSTQLKSMIGTDEDRLYFKADVAKPESGYVSHQVSALYSKMRNDFWDMQVGVRYRNTSDSKHNFPQGSEGTDAVFGIHGLAPYFFQTDAHIYIGMQQYLALAFSFERDILLTQQWIMQPYFEVDVLLHDEASYAKSTGLSELQIGLQTRYEINKWIKPFFDIRARYEQGRVTTNDMQAKTNANTDWQYAVGLALMF